MRQDLAVSIKFILKPFPAKNIVLKNEIHFNFVRLLGFNGNTLCGVKNKVFI